jgi:hypothetical protein
MSNALNQMKAAQHKQQPAKPAQQSPQQAAKDNGLAKQQQAPGQTPSLIKVNQTHELAELKKDLAAQEKFFEQVTDIKIAHLAHCKAKSDGKYRAYMESMGIDLDTELEADDAEEVSDPFADLRKEFFGEAIDTPAVEGEVDTQAIAPVTAEQLV